MCEQSLLADGRDGSVFAVAEEGNYSLHLSN